MTNERNTPHWAAWVVVLAGVSAALHVGKLPPAIPVLREAMGISLVQAGFLLSLFQFAGMSTGVLVGLGADSVGLRRSMLVGLSVLTVASVLGAQSSSATALLTWRAIEGFGFLWTVMPGPALIRRHTAAPQLPGRLGWWGTYMPWGSALALLSGPWVITWLGWPGWWFTLATVSGLAALALMAWVPADPPRSSAHQRSWFQRLSQVLSTAPPWWVALCFSVYSSQWLAVVGFMPTISHQMGWSAEFAGAATAFVALVNVTGNVGSGHLLQRGWAAKRLLWLGFTCMASGAILAFLDGAPVGLRFAGVLVFSACGGLIPGTLFSMAVQLAPSEDTVSSTVGWVQQLSAVGQFVGPPLVAWVAAASGGWHYTGWVCAACSLVGMALAWRIHQSLLHKQRSA